MSAHSGMSPGKARLLASIQAHPRSDEWIYVTIDEQDDSLVNASGIYPDEHSAFLAAEDEARENRALGIGNDYRNVPIPLFRAKGQHAH